MSASSSKNSVSLTWDSQLLFAVGGVGGVRFSSDLDVLDSPRGVQVTAMLLLVWGMGTVHCMHVVVHSM